MSGRHTRPITFVDPDDASNAWALKNTGGVLHANANVLAIYE